MFSKNYEGQPRLVVSVYLAKVMINGLIDSLLLYCCLLYQARQTLGCFFDLFDV